MHAARLRYCSTAPDDMEAADGITEESAAAYAATAASAVAASMELDLSNFDKRSLRDRRVLLVACCPSLSPIGPT